MLRRRVVLVVTAGLLCAVGGAAVTGQAAARRAPSVTLTALTPKIDVGGQPKFQYSTTSAPSGSVAVLQLLQVSSATWIDVATRAPGTNKTVQAPAVSPLGKYTYRMQVRQDADVVTQTPHNHDVYAYGTVSMKSVCPGLIGVLGRKVCAKNTTKVGATTLVTSTAVGAAQYPDYSADAYLTRTSCRSATLQFTNPHNASAKTWLKVHQTGDQVGYAGHNAVGHLNATLTGGQFYLEGSTEGGRYSVYIAGSWSCWTATGKY